MKKERIFLEILVLAGIAVFLGSAQLSYAGDWKITDMKSLPGCYVVGKENPVRFFFTFQAPPSPTPGDLVIKVLYQSNIERFEKKLNLTQAVASTCGPHATSCPVNWDGEGILVQPIAPGYYGVTKDGIIGPKVRGSVITTIEAYTVDAKGARLTDRKTLRVRDCPRPVPKK